MTAPLAIYRGRTTHARRTPFAHRFAYPIAPFLFDLGRLDEAAARLRFFSHNRRNLFSLHDRDHGPRDGAPLRPWAESALAEAGVALDGGRLELLCFPRILNYVFNPISIWFGYGPDGDLRGVIFEVHNTFGQAHSYVAAAPAAAHGEAEKVFHVSPFFPVRGAYRFAVRAPADRFALTVRKRMDGAESLVATMALRRASATDRALAAQFLRAPLASLMVTARIHWQALRLVLKGARYHHPPAPPRGRSIVRPAAAQPGAAHEGS